MNRPKLRISGGERKVCRPAGQERGQGLDQIVAQVSNLLYRSASSLRTPRMVVSNGAIGGLPIGNRRYSRLETCATSARSWIPKKLGLEVGWIRTTILFVLNRAATVKIGAGV